MKLTSSSRHADEVESLSKAADFFHLLYRSLALPLNSKCNNRASSLGTIKLLQEYATVAVLGGGMVYQYMLEHDLLDELYVTMEPIIFGRGVNMFAGGTRTMYAHLLSVRRLNRSGTMLFHYSISR